MTRFVPLALVSALGLATCISTGCSAPPATTPADEQATSDEEGGPDPVAPAPTEEEEQHDPDGEGYVTRVNEGAGVAFDLGARWKLSGEEGPVLATSPDGKAVLMFHVVEPENLEAALQAVRTTLAAEVKDAYFGPPKKLQLGGPDEGEGQLTAEYATGAGKLTSPDGPVAVELGQLLVATPKQRVLVVVVVIEASAPAAAKAQARHTLKSIRPAGRASP